MSYDILNLFSDDIESAKEKLINLLPDDVSLIAADKHQLAILLLPNLTRKLMVDAEWTILAHYMIAEAAIDGASVSDKIEAFCSMLLEEPVKDYFKCTFPVLSTMIQLETEQWINHSNLVIRRYLDNAEEIQSTLFRHQDVGQVCSIHDNLGDKHYDGMSVTLLTFETGQKLIYSPMKRDLYQPFAAICQWVDESLQIGFKLPAALIKDTYSWFEFIEHHSCSSTEQIHRFYERSGVNLALLYTMEGTDFHYENIIACGDFPVLIDLETFFHPFMPFEDGETTVGFYNSVLKTGLLPTGFSSQGNVYPDMSGLGNPSASLELNKSLRFVLDNNGHIMAQRKKGFLKEGKNRPLLQGVPVDMSATYAEDLKQGFCKTYTFLCRNKQAYLEKLSSFKNKSIRLIFRNTSVYAHLLKESKHPDKLKDDEQQASHLDWLNLLLKEYPAVNSFLEAEKEDLRQLTIPYFYTQADSRSLWHNGKCLEEDFFNQSGFQTSSKKILQLSDEDLNKQCWIIDICLSMREKERFFPNSGFKPTILNTRLIALPGTGVPAESACSVQADFFLETAKSLANNLLKSIKVIKDEAYWMVFRPVDLEASHFELAPASFDLYSGMPGEIICFTCLEKQTGMNQYGDIALKAAKQLVNRIDESIASIHNLGIFGGFGGIIYLMALLTKIRKENDWTEQSLTWLKQLNCTELAAKEASHGLVNGTAGFIIACLAAYQASKEEAFITLADKLSGILIRSALPSGNQLKWKGVSKQPLAGLSHGASGYALCFSRLYHYTGTKRYKDIVRKILNYETHLYNPAEMNWPDLRDFVVEKGQGSTWYSTAWSHGAPGIGLTRIELLKNGIKNRQILKDHDIAVQTCLQKGFGGSHNLCFGDFGNLELLINSAEFFHDDQLKGTYRQLAKELVQDGMTNGFRLTKATTYTPGLMNGITGVIFQCLRLYQPKTVPSLLSLSI
ncbi:MAG: type 2 lanthipeptide synthetase LanM [Bacteroidota bacterium]|nr:type 2 lanthipeptide synthetase LanM [Bacteroidota bacterium]